MSFTQQSKVNDKNNLISMLEELSRRTGEVIDAYALRFVDQHIREEFRRQILAEANTVIVAVLNDVRKLEHDTGVKLFTNQTALPGPSELAAMMEAIFGPGAKDRPAQEVAMDHLRWIFLEWMHVKLRFFMTLGVNPKGDTALPASTKDYPGDLQEPYAVVGILDRLKHLTLVYLQQRSVVVEAFGLPDDKYLITVKQPRENYVMLAQKAYEHGHPTVGMLLLRALRQSLLRLLQLDRLPDSLDLHPIKTHEFLVLAHRIGVALPFDLSTLANLSVDLEIADSRCKAVDPALLFTAVRVIEEAVPAIERLRLTDEQVKKVQASIKPANDP